MSFVMLPTQSSTKGATYYGIAVALLVSLKAILDDENAVLPLQYSKKVNTVLKTSLSVNSAVVGAHGIVRPVNIPLNDAETPNASFC